MQAVILSCGDELVLGQTVDTNSAYLSAQLARLGIGTLYHQTVADDQAAIATAIRQASTAAELVIVSGGLGPTDDDLTRQALADALGAPLVLHEESVAVIASFFTRRGRPMPERNQIQAMHPAGTTIIPNSCGTAPGIKAKLNRAVIYVAPGVPRELYVMFERSILPELQATPSRGVILTATIHTFGMGESSLAERLGNLMDRARNPKVGTTVSGGIVSIRLRSEFDDPRKAHAELDATAAAVRACVGPAVFGSDGDTLAGAVVSELRRRQRTLATAESCTGGLLGKLVTDVPGSSAAYVGGWVTYSNALKMAQLGVHEALLERHGAVSQPVVKAMARGALERGGADLALAITGVAGPDGGTPEKPVGTVWVGLAWRAGAAGSVTDALLIDLPGAREMIRDRAAKCALQMLRYHLLDVPLDELLWGRRVREEG